MARFSKIWYWLVVIAVLILVAGITTLFPQTDDVPMLEETSSPGNTDEITPLTKVEPQSADSTTVNLQDTVKKTIPVELGVGSVPVVDFQHRFNELKSEYLDDRADYIDMWLAVVAIVLTFFGIVIAILGIIGYRRFRELEAEANKSVEEARKLVEEIKEHRARAEEYVSGITSENIDDPDEATEVEEAIRDLQSDPEPSLISKVITEIYTLQRDGKIEDVIEKWRSIANIAEGNDNKLAARAWLSIRYFLAEEEDRLDAYNRAMNLDPSYTRTYMNQYRAKYSNLSPHGIVIGAVLRYFDTPKFEKFSTVQEYQIESGHYRADVVLQDEKGQLATIVECMVNEYIPGNAMTYLKEHFRRSGAQFGLLAIGPDNSKWIFLKILENEITTITRSEFENTLVESDVP